MIFSLFPAVAVPTAVLQRTAVGVSPSFLLRAPDDALVFRIVVHVQLASEILPVVSVDAGVTGM